MTDYSLRSEYCQPIKLYFIIGTRKERLLGAFPCLPSRRSNFFPRVYSTTCMHSFQTRAQYLLSKQFSREVRKLEMLFAEAHSFESCDHHGQRAETKMESSKCSDIGKYNIIYAKFCLFSVVFSFWIEVYKLQSFTDFIYIYKTTIADACVIVQVLIRRLLLNRRNS